MAYQKHYTRKAQDNSPAAQLQRAIANAKKNDVRVIGQGTMRADGSKFFICPSQSVQGMCHVVKVEKTGLTCDCFYSSERGKVCAHRAAVYLHLKAAVEAPKPATQPARSVPDRAAMSEKERRETALPYDSGEGFSIYASTPRERRYQTLEDEAASRDGLPNGEYYQHAYR